MSRLRREPGECGVERLNSRDQYGDYYVEHCYFDANVRANILMTFSADLTSSNNREIGTVPTITMTTRKPRPRISSTSQSSHSSISERC